jgi:hypothetical protein
MPIAVKASLLSSSNAVVVLLKVISRKDAIHSGTFCMPLGKATVMPWPLATYVPKANDPGV